MDLLLYVDDCCITFDKATSAEIYQKFLTELSATFKYTGGGAAEHFLGFGISRDRELGQIQLDQHGFVEQMLADYNVKKDVTQLIPAAAGNLLGMNLCPPPGAEGDDEREYHGTCGRGNSVQSSAACFGCLVGLAHIWLGLRVCSVVYCTALGACIGLQLVWHFNMSPPHATKN
jgi:hypothetical protein